MSEIIEETQIIENHNSELTDFLHIRDRILKEKEEFCKALTLDQWNGETGGIAGIFYNFLLENPKQIKSAISLGLNLNEIPNQENIAIENYYKGLTHLCRIKDETNFIKVIYKEHDKIKQNNALDDLKNTEDLESATIKAQTITKTWPTIGLEIAEVLQEKQKNDNKKKSDKKKAIATGVISIILIFTTSFIFHTKKEITVKPTLEQKPNGLETILTPSQALWCMKEKEIIRGALVYTKNEEDFPEIQNQARKDYDAMQNLCDKNYTQNQNVNVNTKLVINQDDYAKRYNLWLKNIEAETPQIEQSQQKQETESN